MAVGFGEGVEQFQAGRQLAGENAVGVFIKNLLGQVNKLTEVSAEAKLKREGEKPLSRLFSEEATKLQARQMFGQPPPPKPLSTRQTDAIEGVQSTLSTLNEMEDFLKGNPEVQTGMLNPEFRRDLPGDVWRSFVEPKKTQFAQTNFRMQDAYRRFVTGVQAGFGEVSQFLPSSLPNPQKQPRDVLIPAIQTFRQETMRAAEQMKRAMRLRGYSEQQIAETFAPLPSLSEFGRPVQPAGDLSDFEELE